MNYISISNNQTIALEQIPQLSYLKFSEEILYLLIGHDERHCVNYFGVPQETKLMLYFCIADDETQLIYILSSLVDLNNKVDSLTPKLLCLEKFEREIHENFGLQFDGHPWLKPVRYAHNRHDKSKVIANYPFYEIDSDELHEVGVGPIHAGVIEPGHFRFICNGEQILHLEIQLGYQHRGVERLFCEKKKLLQRATLAENIAGDTVVGHTTTFSHIWESLCGIEATCDIEFSRTLALELERMAIHTGDMAAVCADIAYQLGNAVLGRLRTPMVNYFQEWCGNRLAKGLIRPGYNPFPFTPALAERLQNVLNIYEPDFNEISNQIFSLPSSLSRLERTGVVSNSVTRNIGAVGMAARTSNLERDIRKSHPYSLYAELNHQPIVKRHGDVYSRVQIRRLEIGQSMQYIRQMIQNVPAIETKQNENKKPQANAFALSLVEGWRGEICHCAITNNEGEIVHYKIKDPSFHNWLALALSVRNNEISDFPICNKSFNLSYCGHDL